MENILDDLSPLKKDDYKPLYAQISDALIEYIKRNGLKPGDPFPSETDVIEKYGVSRTTVRIAFQRLATEGLITKVQGKGTFIAKPKISGFIQGIRPLEESLADQGIEIATIPLDVGLRLNPTQIYLKDLELPPDSKVFRVFRLKKTGNSPLAIENRYLPLEIAKIFSLQDLNEKPLVELLNSEPETEINRVVYRTRSEILLERHAEILEVPPGTPALIQGATYYNLQGRPILTGSMIFLADRIEIRYEYRKQDNSWSKQHVLKSP
ncbi:MAG: GntR family transcriptional regulator [Syntrophaceae bacterium]|jgi:GntR family transcriptional regulator|nr:GntR family transcriptional regulator [Syntrophaceae bacterium]